MFGTARYRSIKPTDEEAPANRRNGVKLNSGNHNNNNNNHNHNNNNPSVLDKSFNAKSPGKVKFKDANRPKKDRSCCGLPLKSPAAWWRDGREGRRMKFNTLRSKADAKLSAACDKLVEVVGLGGPVYNGMSYGAPRGWRDGVEAPQWATYVDLPPSVAGATWGSVDGDFVDVDTPPSPPTSVNHDDAYEQNPLLDNYLDTIGDDHHRYSPSRNPLRAGYQPLLAVPAGFDDAFDNFTTNTRRQHHSLPVDENTLSPPLRPVYAEDGVTIYIIPYGATVNVGIEGGMPATTRNSNSINNTVFCPTPAVDRDCRHPNTDKTTKVASDKVASSSSSPTILSKSAQAHHGYSSFYLPALGTAPFRLGERPRRTIAAKLLSPPPSPASSVSSFSSSSSSSSSSPSPSPSAASLPRTLRAATPVPSSPTGVQTHSPAVQSPALKPSPAAPTQAPTSFAVVSSSAKASTSSASATSVHETNNNVSPSSPVAADSADPSPRLSSAAAASFPLPPSPTPPPSPSPSPSTTTTSSSSSSSDVDDDNTARGKTLIGDAPAVDTGVSTSIFTRGPRPFVWRPAHCPADVPTPTTKTVEDKNTVAVNDDDNKPVATATTDESGTTPPLSSAATNVAAKNKGKERLQSPLAHVSANEPTTPSPAANTAAKNAANGGDNKTAPSGFTPPSLNLPTGRQWAPRPAEPTLADTAGQMAEAMRASRRARALARLTDIGARLDAGRAALATPVERRISAKWEGASPDVTDFLVTRSTRPPPSPTPVVPAATKPTPPALSGNKDKGKDKSPAPPAPTTTTTPANAGDKGKGKATPPPSKGANLRPTTTATTSPMAPAVAAEDLSAQVAARAERARAAFRAHQVGRLRARFDLAPAAGGSGETAEDKEPPADDDDDKASAQAKKEKEVEKEVEEKEKGEDEDEDEKGEVEGEEVVATEDGKLGTRNSSVG